MNDQAITERELREAFRRCGLRRNGWTFRKAMQTSAVYIALRATVKALRGKEQQQHGKPAPIQRAIF